MVYLQDKNFSYYWQKMPFLAPPAGEHTSTIPALPSLYSPGWTWSEFTAFLSEHSTQAKKDEKRKKETKSYFYGKLRSDYGPISQVNLNKSIKAYPNMKKRLQLPLPLFFFAVYIWQSKMWPGICESVYLKHAERR